MKEDDQLSSEETVKPIFKRALIAAAFSPRLPVILNESYDLLKAIKAVPTIIHVGEDTSVTREKLSAAVLGSLFQDQAIEILIKPGNAVDVIVKEAKRLKVDLIVAGALKKVRLLTYYMGSIARQLANKAPASLLLFTDPKESPEPFKKIQCAVEYDRDAKLAVEVAVEFVKKTGSEDLYFSHSFRVPEWEGKSKLPTDSKEIRRVYHSEDRKLIQQLNKWITSEIQFNAQCLYEKSYHTTLDFAKDIEADLLVMPGPGNRDSLWDRIFPHDTEKAMQNLPCSILFTRRPKKKRRGTNSSL